ncbi:MAG: GIY-YIG nuclease family protein [Firmicutes bacterium]|nr:GIY-YIG nuclease family protein [Bacillota bacterium]
MDDNNKNYVYIVECSDGSLYTGWTTDVAKRVEAHNSGKGAKYTRSRRPVKLVHYEEFPTKEKALRREAQIKKLTPAKKRQLFSSSSKEK